MKVILLLISFFTGTHLYAQYEYTSSEAFPYGQPNLDAPEQIKDYHLLIGKCNCKSTSRNQDQTWAKPVDMTWTWKYIMNGMAIQDETLKADGRHSGSIRQYNVDSAQWYVHYYSTSSVPQTLPTWYDEKEDGKIILYKDQKSPNGQEGYFRLSFYDISTKGYKWIGEWVSLDESIIYPTWKIDCKKE
ncbi:hypothetical protein [Portibacter lacus]|uniref:Uncharacterized protein n=1 Tax=Portibacter lacus TaxID=1099794 RepID=A0AA37WFT6_9BACT|nr:hypothetical protein [Portibacter lacus]GLR18957.1 hypothetical protein GCM10007940_35730 [Portibacter lacus]